MTHAPEPTAALNPADAARLGFTADDLVHIETDVGAALLRVSMTAAQRPGELFVPMHWTEEFTSAGPIGRAVTARLDPHSGQPELKATPTSVSRVEARFMAFCCDVPVARCRRFAIGCGFRWRTASSTT